MIEIYNGVVTNRVTYTLPTGKSEMHFLKIIRVNGSGLKALLHLETSTGNISYAVADINPSTLAMSNLVEIDFVAGYNEEIGIDLFVGDNNIYSLSTTNIIAGFGNPTDKNKELKITNISQALQGNSCFSPIAHSSTTSTYPYGSLILNYSVAQNNYSGGGFVWNYFDIFFFDGYKLGCNNNIEAQYKTTPIDDKPKISISNPNKDFVKINTDHLSTIDIINLYDLKGSLIKTSKFTGNQNLNIEFLQSGIYVLEITFNNGDRVQKKLIKN